MALPVENVPARVQRFFMRLAPSCCVLVVCAVICYVGARSSKDFAAKYGVEIYGRDQNDKTADNTAYEGFYSKEKDQLGDCRWSGKNSIMRFSAEGLYRIDYMVPTMYIDEGPPEYRV